jgi:isopenicillin N synthase-like dioxygenase
MFELDARDLRDPDPARRRAAVETLGRAGRCCGAFALRGHDVDPALLARALEATRALFALDPEALRACAAEPGNPRGFHPLPRSGGDRREKFFLTTPLGCHDPARPSSLRGENRWPAGFDALRPDVEACLDALTALGRTLLAGMTEALGAPPTALDREFAPPGGAGLWLLHYPPVPLVNGQQGQGASAHRDLHPLALIVQDDQQALDVRCGDAWHAIDPARTAIAGQMGELVARWSNDVFVPNVHRVRSPRERARYSLALFMQPALDAVIAPLDACVSADRPARYAPASFDACFEAWIRALDEGTAGYVPGV